MEMEHKDLSKITILFVDDEKLIRNSFARNLRAEGFTVVAVDSGSEAIKAMEDRPYDLVITDLMMPGIDGFGVLKAAKKLAPQTSVIIFTGYGDMLSAIESLRLGADDFTLKPCEIDELVIRVRRCLEKQNLLQMLASKNQQLEEEVKQRLLVEEQLRESENRFRLALDAATNGVWERNLLTGEVYYGENWLQTLGYADHKEFIDKHMFERVLHPDDLQKVLKERERHIQGKSPRYEVEYRIRNKAGGWQWMLSRGKAIARDEQGKAQRIIGTITDITRLKEFETRLEQRVQERTVELSEANIALTVLLKKREQDRDHLAEQVFTNTTKLVDPYFDRLHETRLTEEQQKLVDIIRANIGELTSPFANKYSTKMARLTVTEIQIANLVKKGKKSKEIAEIMRLSPGTINVHRKNIRRKLGIAHQEVNLQTMLSLDTE